MDKFAIPFLIHRTDNLEPIERPFAASQRDIAPTILDFMGWEQPKSFAGLSLLRHYENRFSDYYTSGLLGWIKKDKMIEVDIHNTSQFFCYSRQGSSIQYSETTCSKAYHPLRNEALSFTKYSQDLLFKGKTETFQLF